MEFPRELPKGVLVTFDFHQEAVGRKVATVPGVVLGPNTVRVKFPG